MTTVAVPGRFNGPPGSANGGYACGLVAARIGPRATVRLLAPPPLDTPLDVVEEDGAVRLRHGDVAVAEGRPGAPDLEVPEVPALGVAEAASQRFTGRRPEDHAFPTCFVCGPLRGEGDGLRIFAGPVAGGDLLACAWTPAADLAGEDGTVDPPFVWAALDCPSGFACIPPGTTTVLATMTAALEAPVHPGRTYVVTAWHLGDDGRKHRAGSAIHTPEGERVGVADALWITLRT